MSLTNPKKVVTEQRLNEFYNQIFPYLGGVPEAGFTPVGTVIALMSNTAPTNYLACNGQTVNIADYVELADHFEQQFGSVDYFGGDGTTTFGIPDLRGEFLRGSGTNSHENCGDGGNVGTHQDGTAIPAIGNWSSYQYFANSSILNYEKEYSFPGQRRELGANIGNASSHDYSQFGITVSTRPTNTSILYCIATKNIYLNPSLDYSTNEKVVGHWIDGKPLYQKTYNFITPNAENGAIIINADNTMKDIISMDGGIISNDNRFVPINWTYSSNRFVATWRDATSGAIYMKCTSSGERGLNAYITIKYTKTTD